MTAVERDATAGHASSPVDRLREAADLLERLDREATPGPWYSAPNIHGDPRVCTDPLRPSFTNVCEVNTRAEDYGKGNRDLIATLRPLAGPVAAWLRLAAQDIEGTADALFGPGAGDDPRGQRVAANGAIPQAALTVADAVLASSRTEEKR